jgi:asparagine synthase (glutamine-hydrolysing)
MGPRDRITGASVTAGLAAMEHRGPDSDGTQTISLRGDSGRKLVFGHRRLAILDLSPAGAQPMEDSRSGNWITYNGEIYNYRSIRSRLLAAGAEFRSTSDTEVLLSSYSRNGLMPCLKELAGMFAFGIWDDAKQRLILARDHTGIKPLYYYAHDGVFLFASEVRALLATGLVPRRLDPAALADYLRFGSVAGARTLVENVRALEPAQYMIVDADGSAEAPGTYWMPAFRPEADSLPADARTIKGLRDLLETVVSEHLASDVPLGAFLSGGLDSSSIVALMGKLAPGRVRSFSVTFRERLFSEAKYSRLMAQHAGTTHQEIVVGEEDFLAEIPDMLRAVDQPSVDGANVYLISREVRKVGVTVALSGQGGDEVFGGYPTFQRLNCLSKMQPGLRLLPEAFLRLAGTLASQLVPRTPRWLKLPDLVRSCTSLPESYGVIHAIGSASVRAGLLHKSGCNRKGARGDLPAGAFGVEAFPAGGHPANLASALELANFLPNMLLRVGDDMSMASSIEIRVPFLDRRVIDYVAPISGVAKLPREYSKPLLVDAVADLLPPEIYTRKKRGFEFPWERWLRQALRASMEGVLDRTDSGVGLGFEPGACQRLWRSFLAEKGVPWTMIWSLYTLLEWCSTNAVTLETRTELAGACL